MSNNQIASQIMDAVSGRGSRLVQPVEFSDNRQNQLLFFFKPEVFLLEEAMSSRVVELAIDHLSSFGLAIDGALVLGADDLTESNAMDRHYGFINELSRRASSSLSDEVVADIHKALGTGTDTPLLGGHEAATRFSIEPVALDQLWATKKSVKIRSGLYVQSYEIQNEPCVLVNAFHPAQLLHFTGEGRHIALLVLSTDLPWAFLRGTVLGGTFPENALPGSLRRQLYDNASDFGFADISIANNGAHMSAGPFEALKEFENFLTSGDLGYQSSKTRIVSRMTSLGVGSPDTIAEVQTDPKYLVNGSEQSLFDLTEDQDMDSSVALLKYLLSERSES